MVTWRKVLEEQVKRVKEDEGSLTDTHPRNGETRRSYAWSSTAELA
jgi:hypothetical protein